MRFHFITITFLALACLSSCSTEAQRSVAAAQTPAISPDARFAVGERLFRDDFSDGAENWQSELEKGGRVAASNGALEIDVPGGCTVWLKRQLEGPLMISYEATAVSAGGLNDRVSDLNCFWMAQDARSPGDIFATKRSGVFHDYDQLRCYYVGYGGNSNTMTRFRRYIGEKGNRPLRPEHDLTAPEFMLEPNVPVRIQLIAAGSKVGFFRNGQRLFEYEDPAPYTNGWFAFRTVTSHLRIRDFQVHRLAPVNSVETRR
ncbi:MAG TPA: DUF6250 domain-containing protein [Opitutus sp.]|nr:DUF6250 domain-containing protein [Opitutus sp.]